MTVTIKEVGPKPSAEVRKALRARACRVGEAVVAFQEVMAREDGFACGFFAAGGGIYGLLLGDEQAEDEGHPASLLTLRLLVEEVVATIITEDLGRLGISGLADRLDSVATLCKDVARRARQSKATQEAQAELIKMAEEYGG